MFNKIPEMHQLSLLMIIKNTDVAWYTLGWMIREKQLLCMFSALETTLLIASLWNHWSFNSDYRDIHGCVWWIYMFWSRLFLYIYFGVDVNWSILSCMLLPFGMCVSPGSSCSRLDPVYFGLFTTGWITYEKLKDK